MPGISHEDSSEIKEIWIKNAGKNGNLDKTSRKTDLLDTVFR